MLQKNNSVALIMKKIFILLIMFCIGHFVNAQTNPMDVLGDWVNEKRDAKFNIYKNGNMYYGKLIWGKGSEIKDVKNPNPDLRNRDIIGLVLLNNFIYDGNGIWKNGTIYDPREGKTYSCKITIKDKTTLLVRGYVGLSLFGRTETWVKTN
jgi:uncharacterized protein (DUF2147 family)